MIELIRTKILNLLSPSPSQRCLVLLGLRNREVTADRLMDFIKVVTKKGRKIRTGRLYVFLRLMEKEGLIASRNSMGKTYYKLTKEGEKFIEMFGRMNLN